MGLVPMRVPLTLACGAYDRAAGLIKRRPSVEELFAAETRGEYVI
jgi:hypothetical protein